MERKTYYYIHLESGYNGYVSTSKISGSPNISVFAPSISTSTKRYVDASENAYLGSAAHYSTTHAPNRAQMVDYLGKKADLRSLSITLTDTPESSAPGSRLIL